MRGNREVFLALLFITFTIGDLSGADLEGKLVALLGFPQMWAQYTDDSDGATPRRFIISTEFSDLYRKNLKQTRVLSFNAQGYGLVFVWPIRIAKASHRFEFQGGQNQYFFDNLKDATTLVGRIHFLQPYVNITWTAILKNWLLGGGIRAEELRTENTFRITGYPRSSDQLANQFFFDLLEPTFGRKLQDSLVARQMNYALWGGFPIAPRYRLTAGIAFADCRVNWSLRYLNTGSKAALSGPRRLTLPINAYGRQIQLALTRAGNINQEIAIAVFQNRMDLYIDNHPPAFIDFDSLGDMQLERSGTQAKFGWNYKHWRWQIGLSLCNYNGQAFVRTPVLGFQWGIIPIAHSATLDLSSGHSFSQLLAVSRSWSWRHLFLEADLSYYHVVYDFWIKGRADLEFGLTTRPLDYPYRYALHWWDLGLRPEWRKGKWGISYCFRQAIPYGRRLDKSPINFIREKEGVDYTRRGGRWHQLELQGYF